MSRVRLLNCIHRQSANGVDAQRFQLLAGRQSLLSRYHEGLSPWEFTSSTNVGGSARLSDNGSRNGKSCSSLAVYQFLSNLACGIFPLYLVLRRPYSLKPRGQATAFFAGTRPSCRCLVFADT